MSSPIVTGSGGERFMKCIASTVLPRAFDELAFTVRDGKLVPATDATRGIEVHAHLERVADGVDPETSLDIVDASFREAAAQIDLAGVRDLTALAPEVSFAVRPATGTARVLGQALGRAYSAAGVQSDEIPLTIDVVGDSPGRAFIGDYKTGWQRITPTAANWQMRTGALAAARAFDRDEVEAQLVFIRESKPVRRDRHMFDAGELVVIEAEIAQQWDVVHEAREAFDAGKMPEATRGPWCKHCPSRHVCPAQHALIQAAIAHAAPGPQEISRQVSLMTHEQLASSFRRLKDLKVAFEAFEAAIYKRAAFEPILLETEDDGSELWLGMAEKLGNRELDPDATAAALREFFPDDPEVVDEVLVREATIGRLENAVRARVARGAGAARIRRVIAEIDKRGGIARPIKSSVHVYKLAPEQPRATARRVPELRVIDGGGEPAERGDPDPDEDLGQVDPAIG